MTSWVALALAAGVAQAAPEGCDETFDPDELRDMALLFRSGVDRGDMELVRSMNEAFEERIPCLAFAPEPHTLAEVLVLRAVTEYASDGDWETPMAAALRIWPGVDRVVSSRHPLYSWEPPAPAEAQPLPQGRSKIYVDGLPAETLPADGDLALVQRTDGTWWNSVLVTPDQPLPDGWESQPVVPLPHIAFRAVATVGIAGVGRFQEPDFDTDWVRSLDPTQEVALVTGGTGHLVTTFYSPFGVYLSSSAWVSARSPGLDVHACAAWAPRHLVLGAGLGTISIVTTEGPEAGSRLSETTGLEEVRQRYMLRYIAGVVRTRWGDRTRWEAGLDFGGSASASRVAGDFALGLPRGERALRWVLGLGFSRAEGRFEQVGAGPGRRFTSGDARTWLSVGWAWGEDS